MQATLFLEIILPSLFHESASLGISFSLNSTSSSSHYSDCLHSPRCLGIVSLFPYFSLRSPLVISPRPVFPFYCRLSRFPPFLSSLSSCSIAWACASVSFIRSRSVMFLLYSFLVIRLYYYREILFISYDSMRNVRSVYYEAFFADQRGFLSQKGSVALGKLCRLTLVELQRLAPWKI